MKAQQIEDVQKIEAIYACVTVDEEGQEKISALWDVDGFCTPLIASNEESLEVIKDAGRRLSEDQKILTKIVKFSNREVQEVYGA